MLISIFRSFLILIFFVQCNSPKKEADYTSEEKESVKNSIQNQIDVLVKAVKEKDIETYMKTMPEDFLIYDERGEIITKKQQREYALRDWSIIKATIYNQMVVDSIDYLTKDSLFVYTSQRWERIMFQRDGITVDTVLTTQLHKELWKNKNNIWIGYDVEELGGDIFINGEKYDPYL